mgnify:CR=1 FL=1|tara:strand:+ start:1901 stop:2704 length:804 start_codon:yes stop_codon:yes gene_type:complete
MNIKLQNKKCFRCGHKFKMKERIIEIKNLMYLFLVLSVLIAGCVTTNNAPEEVPTQVLAPNSDTKEEPKLEEPEIEPIVEETIKETEITKNNFEITKTSSTGDLILESGRYKLLDDELDLEPDLLKEVKVTIKKIEFLNVTRTPMTIGLGFIASKKDFANMVHERTEGYDSYWECGGGSENITKVCYITSEGFPYIHIADFYNTDVYVEYKITTTVYNESYEHCKWAYLNESIKDCPLLFNNKEPENKLIIFNGFTETIPFTLEDLE